MPAHFDDAGPTVVIDHLDLRDPAVVTEARRWSTGRRGDAVAAAEMTGADVTAFAVQAFSVGAHAIATAGGAQEAYNLGVLVTEVGDRTAEASRQAGQVTDEAIRKATATIETSTTAVRTAIGELGTETRRAFAENVDAAGRALSGEVNRLLGGEHPELLARLAPVIDRFGRELEARTSQQTTELIARAVRQFDPTTPLRPPPSSLASSPSSSRSRRTRSGRTAPSSLARSTPSPRRSSSPRRPVVRARLRSA